MKRLHLLQIYSWICLRAGFFAACLLVLFSLLQGCAQTPPPNDVSLPVVTPKAEEKKLASVRRAAPAPRPLPAQPVIRTASTPQAGAAENTPKLSPPSDIEGQPIRIGLLLPLSGNHGASQLGQAMLNAAMLALFEFGGERLLLMPRDTGGSPDGAAKAAADLVGEGAEIILGPLFNTSVQATAAIARERGLPMIAFSSDRQVAGNGVYLLSFMPDQEVDAVINYAVSQGLQRLAVLAPDDRYGLAVLSAARAAAMRHGAELTQAEFYSPTGEALDQPVKRLAQYHGRRQAWLTRRRELKKNEGGDAQRMLAAWKKFGTLGALDFDAILLPAGGELLNALAPLLPYYDIDTSKIRLLGTGRWDDPKVHREPALLGGWFAGADRAMASEFRLRYQAVFGHLPPRLASLAYDAMALAAVLGQEASGPDFRAEAITNPDGFVGSDGIFRFGLDGIAERGMAVLEIERDGFRVRRRAPTTFEALTN